MKINTLIIDDSDVDRYILRRWLNTCSFEATILEAVDGQDAIDFFEKSKGKQSDGYPPTIIFLDINMPRVNGFEFLEKFESIRERQELASTIIVMFTSSPRKDDRDAALKWDFVSDLMTKGSFDTAHLERVVHDCVALQAKIGSPSLDGPNSTQPKPTMH